MEFKDVEVELAVRPADIDISGHLNNAAALEFLEAGRWAWMEGNGLGRSQTIVPMVARIEIDYVREIFYGHVTVCTRLDADENRGEFSVVFAQSIRPQGATGNVEAVRARVQVAFVDKVERTLQSVEAFIEESRTVGSILAPAAR